MKKHGFLFQFRKEAPFHLMLLPAMIFLLVFSYFPMVGVVMAFQDFVPSGGVLQFFTSEWVGFEYFQYIFALEQFRSALWNTLSIAVVKIVTLIVVPLLLALLLNEVGNKAFKKSVQTIIYVPYFLSWVILGGILTDLLSPTTGVINKVIMALGGESVYFLGDNNYIQGVLIVSNIWKEAGYNTVIFLAALTGIDQSSYEAASIDGAGRWKQFLHITIPGIMPMIMLVTILGLGNVLNAGFDQVLNLYSPITYEKADIIDTLVYRMGIRQLQYSVSAAIGLFRSVVSFILISVSFTLAKKFANYEIF